MGRRGIRERVQVGAVRAGGLVKNDLACGAGALPTLLLPSCRAAPGPPSLRRFPPCPSQVVMWYTVGIAAALLAFQALPTTCPAAIQWFNVFMVGFFLYGPQVRGETGFGTWQPRPGAGVLRQAVEVNCQEAGEPSWSKA